MNDLSTKRNRARRIFHALERLSPTCGRAVRHGYRRLWLARETITGRYWPNPKTCVHFPNYDRCDTQFCIPRVWNVTWKTHSLPDHFLTHFKKIQDLHPSPRWSHRIWTDPEIDAFVSHHYPQRREAYDALPQHIMRVDLFRYMLMHVCGGIYSDLDVRMFKPIDDLISDCRLLLAAETDRPTESNFIAQHFLASAARQPFWEQLLHEALDQPLDIIRSYGDPVEATGPKFITRVWRANADQYAAKVVTRVHLCPPAMLGTGGFSMPVRCYGLHECTGTWR